MKYCFLLVALLLAVSCDDNDDHGKKCTFDDSIDSYPWIMELKNSMTNCTCEISIIQGTYRQQTVVFMALTDPLCNGIDTPILYDCDGRPIKSFSNTASDQKELTDKVTRDKVLYRCKL